MLKKEIPIRSYTGDKWKSNASNKKHLAIDFKHRCAYCDDLDNIYNGKSSYAVEHFAPKGKFPQLRFTYDNLLYACRFCNTSKSDDWPSDSPKINVVGERGYVDPCTNEYYIHLDRDNNTGCIFYKTEIGKYMYEHLKLYLKRHSVSFMMEKIYAKREELEESIKEDINKGLDISIKKEVLITLDREFISYYDELRIQDT